MIQMKVKVYYLNEITYREGCATHNVPNKYSNNIDGYLSIEVRKWNPDNRYLFYENLEDTKDMNYLEKELSTTLNNYNTYYEIQRINQNTILVVDIFSSPTNTKVAKITKSDNKYKIYHYSSKSTEIVTTTDGVIKKLQHEYKNADMKKYNPDTNIKTVKDLDRLYTKIKQTFTNYTVNRVKTMELNKYKSILIYKNQDIKANISLQSKKSIYYSVYYHQGDYDIDSNNNLWNDEQVINWLKERL